MKQKPRIAILGPAFSFSDLAFRKFLRKQYSARYFTTIPQIFRAVTNGKAEKGFVPVKNSISAKILETGKELRKWRSKITTEKRFLFPVSHVLAALPGVSLSEIHTFLSHPVIFDQCGKFFKNHFPHAKKRYSKTSSAACAMLRDLANKKKAEAYHTAVTASVEAVRHFDLKILKRHVENKRGNTTAFSLFRKKK